MNPYIVVGIIAILTLISCGFCVANVWNEIKGKEPKGDKK